jgi:hypothetical protein
MPAPTVKEPTDTDPGTSAKWGAPDATHLVKIIKGTHATERIPVEAIEGTAVSLSANQQISGAKTFNSSSFKIRNPGDSFSYTFVGSAIAADRNITLPLLVANDTLVTENFTQTLTNKTINATANTLIGVARTDASNTFGDFNNTFRSSRLLITNPANTFNYTFVGSAITADRNITLPLLTANDTLVTAAFAQTLTNKTIDASANTISNITNTEISSSAAITLSKLATLTASKALVSDGSGVISTSSVTSTELGYVSGVTSAIQTQLDAKVNLTGAQTVSDKDITVTKRVTNDITTITYSATTNLDLDANEVQTLSLTGNVTFTTSNRAAGKHKTVKISCDGTQRTLTFPSWKFVGNTAPANIAANKTAILTITCFGTADTDIVAAYSVEQ